MQPSWSMENVVVPTEAVAEASVQNATCMPALRDPVVANTDYYCLPANWVKGWQMFALGRSTAQPGMIDNTILIDRITKDMVLVKKELSPGQDYEIIPASVWNKFVKWYALQTALEFKDSVERMERNETFRSLRSASSLHLVASTTPS